MSIYSKLSALLSAANTKTGESDTTLTDAVQTLIDGYGGGGGGGTGASEIASGTFTPSSDSTTQNLAIGKKMAQTDFLIVIYADNGTEVAYDTTYKGMVGVLVCDKALGYYDLQTDVSGKTVTGKITYKINQRGTITDKEAFGIYGGSLHLRNSSTGSVYADIAHNKITRDSSGFTLTLRWTSQNFMSGITYNYKVLYYGTTPTTDIVEVA